MSLEMLANRAFSAGGEKKRESLLALIADRLQVLIDLTGIPFKILVSPPGIVLNVNVANDTLMLAGRIVPQGQIFTINDFTVSFRTNGGTVKLVAVDSNGTVRDDILVDISASGSGAGGTVLEQGETLAVMVQTQGAGTVTVRCSGILRKVRGF